MAPDFEASDAPEVVRSMTVDALATGSARSKMAAEAAKNFLSTIALLSGGTAKANGKFKWSKETHTTETVERKYLFVALFLLLCPWVLRVRDALPGYSPTSRSPPGRGARRNQRAAPV